MSDISFLVAFVFGILSFLAPCIFPLMPGILGYVAGTETRPGYQSTRMHLLLRTALFSLGFSLVFIASGALVGFFGFYLRSDVPIIEKIAGAILVVFGLHLIGILKIPFLYRQRSLNIPIKRMGIFAPVLVGMAFGLGWSPCMGPVIGGILTLAYASETALQGTLLLATYSAGLTIPFLVSALLMRHLMAFLKRRRVGRVLYWVEKASGVLLVTIGILILTDSLILLNKYFDFLSVIGKS